MATQSRCSAAQPLQIADGFEVFYVGRIQTHLEDERVICECAEFWTGIRCASASVMREGDRWLWEASGDAAMISATLAAPGCGGSRRGEHEASRPLTVSCR